MTYNMYNVYCWQTVKLGMLFGGAAALHHHNDVIKEITLYNLNMFACFLVSLFVNKSLSKVFDVFVNYLFKMHRIRRADEVFLPHNMNEETPSNSMAVMTSSKFKVEEMKDFLMENAHKHFRMRSKLVFLFGKAYFKEMDDDEFKNQREIVFTKVDGIHTQKQI
jgi:hypothetical protein